jgi:HAE1 family hydrophobic/amphiphilic exporter-1
VAAILGIFLASLGLVPLLGLAYFPRTDPGQFVINLKAAPGTRIELTENEVTKVENLVRSVVAKHDMRLVVSNIGSTPDLSSIYTSNSAPNTAYVQVSLADGHKVGSYEYMDRVRTALHRETPELTCYVQSGGLVDAVLNQGIPAPIDVQVTGNDLDAANTVAEDIRARASAIPGVSDAFIPQDIHAPALQLDIDRYHAMEMGLTEHEVVDNVVTALTSDGMIAPSYWVDPKSGNLYMLTVQYPESTVKTLGDLKTIPVRSALQHNTALLDTVAALKHIDKPTEVDHYQLRRVVDVYVAPHGEELSRVAARVNEVISKTKRPSNILISVRGIVGAMNTSFRSFGIGLILALVLVYLVLVAQFKSFIDPFIILLAVPPGVTGVLIMLTATGTTLNIMSLMGIVMMVGVVVSNSILIVEFTHRLIADGMALGEAVRFAVRVRLRPVLMTSLATVIGLIPMALALGAGSESYAPLARSIIGGLVVSVALTVFIVPAAFLVWYRRKQ